MAITKLISPSTPNPLPPAGAGGDWDKAMAQLTAVKKLLSGEQMILTQWTNNTTAPALARGSYLQHMGAIYVIDTEDYALPALSVDGTYYIKLTISGETLVPSYITDLTGFSWSAQHNGLYNASDEQVLPYQVLRVDSGASIIKRKVINLASVPNKLFLVDYLGVTNMGNMAVEGNTTIGGDTTIGGTLGVTGAISGASINTGDGAIKLYSMGVENISLTATSSDSSITIADMVIGKEVLLNMELTAANNYDAQVYLPPTGKYEYEGVVYNGGARIVDYSMTTQSTVTRMRLVRRIE